MMYQKSKKKKRGGAGKILLAVLAVLLLGAVAAGFLASREISGSGAAGDPVIVTVPEGASTLAITGLLKEQGLIRSTALFRLYSKLKKADGSYQHGDHEIQPGSSYDQIIEALQQMTIKDVETVSVTFPEGTTALKMALILADKGMCTVQEFVDACNNDSYDVSFLGEISSSADKFIRLEGFLFPDTYEFALGSTAHDMIQKMLENFEAKVYTEENRALVAASGYSFEENIIMASIVEKESDGDDPASFPMVAGVFWNRLNNWDPALLESDTSRDWVKAGLGDNSFYNEKGYIPGVLGYYYGGYYNIPEGMRDGYDTYTHAGLLVGAICNPGAQAIAGTLSPTAHDYYFFFTGKTVEQGGAPYGGAGRFYYFETYSQHAAAWSSYGIA